VGKLTQAGDGVNWFPVNHSPVSLIGWLGIGHGHPFPAAMSNRFQILSKCTPTLTKKLSSRFRLSHKKASLELMVATLGAISDGICKRLTVEVETKGDTCDATGSETPGFKRVPFE